jgi:hypothetical protein
MILAFVVQEWLTPLNPFKPIGNYMYLLSYQSLTLYFVFMNFVRFSLFTAVISLNNIDT